jgi:hypothetical protein
VFRARDLWRIATSALATCLSFVACTHTTGDATDAACSPPLGSCDLPAPEMSPVDTARRCLLEAPVALSAVCSTSVNRCAPSDGVGIVCAFAPDGGVFVSLSTDNDVPTATAWRFALNDSAYLGEVPSAELATSAESDLCAQAACMPACSGQKTFQWLCPDAGADAGATTDAMPE